MSAFIKYFFDNKYIFFNFCNDWLLINDFCKLQTALLCCSTNREVINCYINGITRFRFVGIFESSKVFITSANQVWQLRLIFRFQKEYFYWVLNNNILIHHLSINDDFEINSSENLLITKNIISSTSITYLTIQQPKNDKYLLNLLLFLDFCSETNLKNLKEIILNNFNDKTFPLLPIIISVQKVTVLGNNSLSDDSLHYLPIIFPNVTQLNLKYNKISNKATIPYLIKNLKIDSLNLSYSYLVTDFSLYAISTYCFKIKYLNLRSCSLITDNSIINISEKCIFLEYLNIRRCVKLTMNSIFSIAKNTICLKSLILDYNNNYKKIFHVLKQCTLIENLSVRGCPNVMCRYSYSYDVISENPNLKHLDISHSNILHDRNLNRICKYFYGIVTLNLNFCSCYTDIGLISLSKKLKSIEIIYISYNNSITEISIIELVNNCKSLKSINVKFCKHISAEFLNNIKKDNNNIEI